MFHQTRADPGLGATPTPAPSKMVRPPPASLANRSSSLVSRDRMPCSDWSSHLTPVSQSMTVASLGPPLCQLSL